MICNLYAYLYAGKHTRRTARHLRRCQLCNFLEPTTMRIDQIAVGRKPPHDVNVIVEVSVGSEPIKYEMDKAAGTLVVDGLFDVYNNYHRGITAENVAKKYDITRERQDALGSQQKAAAAQEAGRFKDEIVPFSIAQKKGDPIVFATDEFINKKTNAEALAGLRPAGVVLMTAQKAAQFGLTPLARIASYATVALD